MPVWCHHARETFVACTDSPHVVRRARRSCVYLGVVMLLTCAVCPVWAQRPPAREVDADDVVRRVSERLARWYGRAQTVVSRETVNIQPLGQGLSPEGFARRLVHELRVAWHPGELASDGAPVSVVREVLSVNGRPPKPGDEPGCMDPKPVSPEPLAMLLPDRLAESVFSFAGTGRIDGRAVIMLDYRGAAPLPADIVWTDDCVTVSLPGRSRGRIWVDAETDDVLRVDDHLVGQFHFDVPREHVRRGAASSMVIERADSSIRYRPIQFRDPEETLLMPVSVDTLTVIRGGGMQRVRISQRLTDHRRFLTAGRLVE